MATIGSLVVNLGLNAAAFTQGVDRAALGSRKLNTALSRVERSLNGAQRSIARAAKSMLSFRSIVATVAGSAGLGLLIKNSLDAADAIAKTADRIGVSTDALQEFRFAGRLAGVQVSALDNGLEAFSKRLGEARAGTGSLNTMLERTGPAFASQVRGAATVDEAFRLIVNRMGSLENASDRAALSAAAFGRTAGIEMANLVRGGASAFEEATETARRFGLVIDEKLLRQAEKTNDQLTLLSEIMKVRLRSAVLQIAPAMSSLLSAFLDRLPQIVAGIERIAHNFGLITDLSQSTQLLDALEREKQVLQQIADIQDQAATARRRAGVEARFGAERAAQIMKGDEERLARLNDRLESVRETIARLKEETAPDLTPRIGIGAPGGAGGDGVTPGSGFNPRPPSRLAAQRAIEQRSMAFIRQVDRAWRQSTMSRIALIKRERDEQLGALQRMALTAEEAAEARVKINEIASVKVRAIRKQETEEALRQIEERRRQEEALQEQLGTGLLDSIERAAAGYADLRRVAVEALRSIIDHVLALQKLQAGGASGGGGLGGLLGKAVSGAFSSIFGGGSPGVPTVTNSRGTFLITGSRAEGGPVSAGDPFLVGEKGPELFVPKVAGNVVANGEFGRGRTINNFTIDARGADREGLHRLEQTIIRLNGSIEHRAINAVQEEAGRNPRFRQAVAG